ncbi:MAG: hypothetical protein WC941_02115 [Candidatus Bathyarchaeia archaeon]
MEIDEFFEKNVKQNMYQDIECMMCHGLNFPVATLLAAYTEIIGAVYLGRIGVHHDLWCNYNEMLVQMGYGQVITEFQNKFGNRGTPYEIIRCGLIHECMTKKDSNIYQKYDGCRIGIYIDNDVIKICNERYFEDFKKGVDKIIEDMNKNPDKKQMMNNQFINNNITMSSSQYPISV